MTSQTNIYIYTRQIRKKWDRVYMMLHFSYSIFSIFYFLFFNFLSFFFFRIKTQHFLLYIRIIIFNFYYIQRHSHTSYFAYNKFKINKKKETKIKNHKLILYMYNPQRFVVSILYNMDRLWFWLTNCDGRIEASRLANCISCVAR